MPTRSGVRRLLAPLLVLALAPLATVLVAAPAQAATAAVSGTVQDNIGFATGSVTVDALDAASPSTVVTTTTTDGSGAYSLDLDTGDYLLRFSKTGYVTQRYGGGAGHTISVDGAGNVTDNGVPVADGVLDGVTLISSATHALSGTAVTAVGGLPLSGITVTLYSSADDTTVLDTTTTDGTGVFSFTVHDGQYQLHLADPASHYDARDFGNDTPIVVNGSGVDAGNIQMALGTGPYAVTGSVADVNGDPIAGATVTATHSGTGTDNSTTTAADGTYSMSLALGTYTVGFTKTGFAGANVPGAVVVLGGGTVTVGGVGAPGRALGETDLVGTTKFDLSGTVKTGSTALSGITVEAFPGGDFGATPVTATTNGSGVYTFTGSNGLILGDYVLQFTDADGVAPQYDQTWFGSTTSPGHTITVAQTGIIKDNDVSIGAGHDLGITQMALGTGPYTVTGSVADVNGDPIAGVTVQATHSGTGTDNSTTTASDGTYSLSLALGTYTIGFTKTGFAAANVPGAVVVLAGGTATVGGTPAPGRALGSTTMAGTTKFDLSGTVKTGSTALSGITVQAFPGGDLLATPVTVSTQPDGTYTFTGSSGLILGDYVLQFTDADGVAPQYDQTWFGSTTSPGHTITVAQTGVIKDNDVSIGAGHDLGITQLALGTGPYTVTGSVADVNGDPIAGATVTATHSGTGTDNSTTTASDGTYSLSLALGTYTIGFTKTGFAAANVPGAVVVLAGGTATVGGTPAPGRALGETDLVGTTKFDLSGTVKTGSTALSGITVEAFPGGDFGATPVTATTNGSGVYTFTGSNGLILGDYVLQFTDADGVAPQYDQTWYGSTTSPGHTITVAQTGVIKDNDVSIGVGHDLGITQLALGTGPYSVTGSVADVNGDPIAGVTVTATHSGSGTDNSTTTAANGTYSLSLALGTYTIGFAKTGFAGANVPGAVVVLAGGTATVGGTPAPGRALGETDLVGTAKFDLSGTVKTGSTALSGITVQAFPGGDFGATPVTATTQPDGSYTFTGSNGLILGDYVLQFTDADGVAPQYDQTWYGSTTSPGHTITVAQTGVIKDNDVSIGAGHDLGITQLALGTGPYTVTGSVADVNGDPVAGVTVAATHSGTGTDNSTTTGADGTYSLSLAVGTYSIAFTKTGFAAATIPGAVVVLAGGTATVGGTPAPGRALGETDLVGTTKFDLSGTVKTGSTLLAGITVQAFPGGDLGATPVTTTTNGSGVYTFTGSNGLILGDYVLQFTDADGVAPQYDQTWYGSTTSPGHTITVAQLGAIKDNDVSIGAGHDLGITQLVAGTGPYSVTGSVSDANSDPIAGVTVTATHHGSGTDASTTTGADGTYSLSLALGSYTIAFTKTGFAATPYTVDGDTAATIVVQAGGTVTVNAVTAPGRALNDTTMAGTTKFDLSGTVKTGSTALSGITVEAFPGGDLGATPVTTTTNGTGVYTFTGSNGLILGDYVLQFRDTDGVAPQYDRTWFGSTTSPGHTITVAQGGAIKDSDVSIGGGHDLGITQMVVGTGPYPVTGTVTDANGDEIAGVTVTATKQPSGPATSGTTAADGTFSVSLAVGSYKIRFTKTDFAATDFLGDDGVTVATVTVQAGGTILVDSVEAAGGDVGSTSMVGTHGYSLGGRVLKSGGLALAGITVSAIPQSLGAATRTTTSGSDGTFTLSLPIDTYTIQYAGTAGGTTYTTVLYDGTADGGSTGSAVKVDGTGHFSVDDTPLTTLGDVQLSAASADVPHAVKGTVSDPNFDPLDGVTVTATPVSPTPAGNVATATTGADPDPDTSLGDAGVYKLMLKPGTYKLSYSKTDYQPTTLQTFDDPPVQITLTVSLGGDLSLSSTDWDLTDGVIGDVNMLFKAATFRTLPKLTGKVIVGQTLTVSLGSLTGATIDHDSSLVEWFINGQPADDFVLDDIGQKWQVPAIAATKKITYRVTIADPDAQRASSVYDGPQFSVPKAPSTVTGAFKKGALTVTVKVPTLPKPIGTVTVLEGKKVIGTAKLTNKTKGGKVVLKLKLKKGKHTLTLSYSGGPTVLPATSVLKIKV